MLHVKYTEVRSVDEPYGGEDENLVSLDAKKI
jgi:hypothetical protein